MLPSATSALYAASESVFSLCSVYREDNKHRSAQSRLWETTYLQHQCHEQRTQRRLETRLQTDARQAAHV